MSQHVRSLDQQSTENSNNKASNQIKKAISEVKLDTNNRPGHQISTESAETTNP
jgi:hypothetical protein